MTRIEELIEHTKGTEYYSDLEGLAKVAFPYKDPEASIKLIARFIVEYEQMWHDISNQDPARQAPIYRGKNTFYLDAQHQILNPDLNAEDYLFTFKEFMRTRAYEEKEVHPEKNWHIMQVKLANLIKNYLKENKFI